jgi:outer membrane cobalamin receptor
VRTIAVFLLCLLAVLPSWAQDTPVLDEIVVTATRVDTTILDSPSAVTVITQKDIADSGATDVAGLLNGTPGVVINDYGAAGAAQSVSLRGSTSNQVLVLLDGIRLNSARDGAVDLSTIPMEIIDHIEIVRGEQSALWGSSAIGGVINIITKKGGAGPGALTFSITNGSYIPRAASELSPSLVQGPAGANFLDLLDSQKADLTYAGKLGDVGVTAGGGFTRAANGFTWNDTSVINGWRRMTNADALSGSGYAGIDTPLLGGSLSAKAMFEAADTGAPGQINFPSAAQQTDWSASGSFGWKTDRFYSDALTMDMKGYYRYEELGFNDPAFPPASLHKTNTASLDLTQKLTLSEQVASIYGVNGSYDYADSTNFAAPKDRLNLAGFVSVPFTPLEALTLTPAVRYDYFSTFAGSLSYSLSAVLRLSEQSSLRASLGSAYRAPTLNELYSYYPAYLSYGNPNLKPETSYNGEIGLSFEGTRFSLEASLYARFLIDQISSIWPWDPTLLEYMPVNIGRSLMPGAEISGSVHVTDRISLEASYSFIYSLVLQNAGVNYTVADNIRVPFVPLHSLELKARYDDGVNAAWIGTQYVSEKYTDFANTEANALPGYFIVNAAYRFTATENLAFTLALKNILNTLYYTQSLYPMPPFSVETGVSVKL